MSYDPRKTVDWQVNAGGMQVPYARLAVPSAGGLLSEDLYTDVTWIGAAGTVDVFVFPTDGVALEDVSIGAHTELSVTSLDGAHSLSLYMADAVPLTASGGSGQLVAFGGSTTYNGDAVGLAYDPVAQTITVTNAGMYVVRLAQSLLSTAV